jgi:hypothetical protein
MCFITTTKARAKIAKTDIKCWKYLFPYYAGRKYESACVWNFSYTPNVLMQHIDIKKEGSLINEGYHSYKSKETSDNAKNPQHETYLFIIPKGTRYYENNTEYVSETIMLVK